jgi:hypothetical protein
VQWGKHKGKCGVCGDEYGIKNPKFQYPGAFARNPPIVKSYREGQEIEVQIKITGQSSRLLHIPSRAIGETARYAKRVE